MQVWGELSVKQAAGDVSYVELASGYEKRVLSFWDQAAKRLRAEERTLPADPRAVNALMMKLVSLRQQWVRALIAAAKDPSIRDNGSITELSDNVDHTTARIERLGVLAPTPSSRVWRTTATSTMSCTIN